MYQARSESKYYMEPVSPRRSSSWIAWLLIGITIGLAPGVVKISQMREEVKITTEVTAKVIADLQESVEKEHKIVEQYHRMMAAGDDTKTILMDRTHPYGKFVPPGTVLPAGYAPGPVWIIPRRVAPRTMDGTLNGIYAYELPDGTVDGWYYTGGLR
jgi:hypothetical protein